MRYPSGAKPPTQGKFTPKHKHPADKKDPASAKHVEPENAQHTSSTSKSTGSSTKNS
jgi:hypothetical protein